jgi:arginine-tRNA-protein transferase
MPMNAPKGHGMLGVEALRPAERELLSAFELFPLDGEDCPYFPGEGLTRRSLNFMTTFIEPPVYEALLSFGWRRCGRLFYKNLCESCRSGCLPVRVEAAAFRPDRSQKRCLARNADLEISVDDAEDSDEDFELFSRYCEARHGDHSTSRANFRFFLAEPPVPSVAIRYRLPGGRLVCVAWTDVLPGSLSAVYTAFDPDLEKRALGVHSILRQLELCLQSKRPHLQLGFYIAACRKMSYKSRFAPMESPDADGEWRSL